LILAIWVVKQTTLQKDGPSKTEQNQNMGNFLTFEDSGVDEDQYKPVL